MEHQHTSHDHSQHSMNPPMNHAKHGYAGHDHKGMIADFRRRFFVVAALTVPIMLLSPVIQHWLGVHWQFTGSNYLLFALSSVVFFYGGLPFLKGIVVELRNKVPGMMTLIAVAITVAYA